MFPGAGAQVYRNEEGEVLGWDYPDHDDPHDDVEDWYEAREYDEEEDDDE